MPKSSKPALTPVILGVGEASDPVGAPGYGALSPADLAARAARAAIEDAGAADDLAPRIDLIAAIRQFEVSHPAAIAPFGRADNVPRAVGERIGADPARAILEVVGGQGPQSLVTEMAHAIAAGEVEMALICGAEAISTVRHLTQRGETRDWAETVPGPLEDRGLGGALNSRELARLGARTPITLYALFETARRGRLGLSRDDYAAAMGALFAPFTQVAANNPHAMSRQIHAAAALDDGVLDRLDPARLGVVGTGLIGASLGLAARLHHGIIPGAGAAHGLGGFFAGDDAGLLGGDFKLGGFGLGFLKLF